MKLLNKNPTQCRPRFRILRGDEIALGPGKVDLLEAIQQTGSISAAARKLGMSYRRAWEMVLIANNSFKNPLVKRKVGGKGGGGADLTALGIQIIKLYRNMEQRAMQAVGEDWDRIKYALKSVE